MSSENLRPFCLGLDVLTFVNYYHDDLVSLLKRSIYLVFNSHMRTSVSRLLCRLYACGWWLLTESWLSCITNSEFYLFQDEKNQTLITHTWIYEVRKT